ncbi:hypothetical protein OC844_004678 [Tilletia horrida]|nr:hypothetical protein OC844_004678 [Tilletia horrida]
MPSAPGSAGPQASAHDEQASSSPRPPSAEPCASTSTSTSTSTSAASASPPSSAGGHGATLARVGWAAWKHVRLALPALFASFLLSVLFLIRPVSDWVGPFAFLMFFHLHLFFFPSPLTVGENIQSTLLGLFGSAVGCAAGLLCVAIAHWIDGDRLGEDVEHISYTPYVTSGARAFAACALIFFSFLMGLLSSAAPRFKNFSRISLFNLSWIITRGSVARIINSAVFTEFFNPSLLSAGVGVLANLLIFPKTGLNVFLRDLLQTFQALETLINESTKVFFLEECTPASRRSMQALRANFTTLVSRLGPGFEAAAAEIALVRVPVRAYQPFIKILERSRGWTASGVDVDVDDAPSVPSSSLLELHNPVRALTNDIIESVTVIRICLLLAGGGDLPSSATLEGFPRARALLNGDPKNDPALAHRTVIQQRAELAAAVERLKVELQTHLDASTPHPEISMALGTPHSRGHSSEGAPPTAALDRSYPGIRQPSTFNNRMYAASYLVLCLMEIAQCCIAALVGTQNVLRLWHATTRRHIQWPWTSLHGSQMSIGDWGWRRWASQAGPGTLNDLIGSMETERYGLDSEDIFSTDIYTNETRPRTEEAEAERQEKAKQKEQQSEDALDGSHGAAGLGIKNEGKAVGATAPVRTTFDIFAEADRDLTRRPSPSSTANTETGGAQGLTSPRKRTVWQTVCHVPRLFLAMVRTKEAIYYRVRLSNAIRSFKQSRHIRFAIKLSVGCIVLTIPAWLPVEEAREWWYGERGQWALISYVWCLETSTGATVRVSTFRLIGTVAGSVYGYVIWLICRSNPYALCFFIVLAELFAAYMMLETTAQGIGIVFALTFPIIALIPYLGLPYTSVALLAWERGFMVTIGILAALVVNLSLWPFHARVQLVLNIARATGRLQRSYLSMSRQLLNTDLVTSRDTRKAFEHLERSILKTLAQSRSLIALMSAEVSLAPKPTALLGKIINHLARIADLLVGLRLCRQHGLKGKVHKYLVLNVLDHRTELISAILISFFAVGASIRNRTPLPQFLPSPRIALDDLTASLHEQLSFRETRAGRSTTATPTPDAFHALSSLYHRRPGWRRHQTNSGAVSRSRSPTTRTPDGALTPQAVGPTLPLSSSLGQSLLHSTLTHCHTTSTITIAQAQTSTPATQHPPEGTSGHQHQQHHAHPHQHQGTEAPPPPKLAFFFLLAEHSLLAQIVSELECVLELTRRLVGTATVLEMAYDAAHPDDPAHPGQTWHSLQHQGTAAGP